MSAKHTPGPDSPCTPAGVFWGQFKGEIDLAPYSICAGKGGCGNVIRIPRYPTEQDLLGEALDALEDVTEALERVCLGFETPPCLVAARAALAKANR
jgi:hypothetical protein